MGYRQLLVFVVLACAAKAKHMLDALAPVLPLMRVDNSTITPIRLTFTPGIFYRVEK
jgi:hypothetical protein